MKAAATSLWCALALGALAWPVHADVLIGTNGERFVGKVIQETTNSVVFASELAGQLTFPRAKIRELQLTPLTNNAPALVVVTNPPASPAAWRPPGAGT